MTTPILFAKTFLEMREEVHAVNEANGWFEADRSFAEGIALIHSEISEALEAFRSWGLEDKTGEFCETSPDGIHLHELSPTPCKPEGVGSELADVLIRLLDEAYRQGVDDTFVILTPFPTPFGSSVAELHLCVSTWYAQVETKGMEWGLSLAHTALCAVAEHYGVDLDFEYERKVAYNATRGHRHGGKKL